MLLQDARKIKADEVDSDFINNTTILGLKTINHEHDVGAISQVSLCSYLTDSTPDNTKKTISSLRKATNIAAQKEESLRDKVDKIKVISQADVDAENFELQQDRPISLQSAIDAVTSTYVTASELASMINDVYAKLWETVTEMFTTGFQTSMYARQYTGAIQGISKDKPAYSKLILDADDDNDDDD